ncbi:MAG: 23S rRNA (guanosine(2251)-2'-O)-methyltransferase RlmB [Ilumatobacteraceae bacterium]|jgi:23S rRNA (guanosine2251-2'-O)-methyltransferase|nr:23S rRNA (guanosine(2251)-2'-O)-methyltransferase RlmB [Ilumatobacteraceae bacterium]MBJ7508282.1 23S rRNA (guanosine(2251)-2'-O)-methyltransferase RlmB [Ilumatobacteraceae bacterium]
MAIRKSPAPRKSASPRPSASGKGKTAAKPVTRARPSSKAVTAGKGKVVTPRAVPVKGRNPGPSSRGPRVADPRGAARTGAVPAGPIKPGRGSGRGTGRATGDKDDDLGGTQVEGRQAVRELLIAGRRRCFEVWIAGDMDANEVIDDIKQLARANRVPVVEVSRKKLEYTARSEAPQGVLAHAEALPSVPIEAMLRRRPGKSPFLVAVDGVTDPGNLGALLRCCDGAGVDGVILPRHRSVHITPTVAKAAVGAIEYVPLSVVGGLPTALTRMRELGIWVVGLDDAADKSLFDLGDLASEGICLVVGAEGAGLSRLVRERCDLIVSIPMKGRLSSLNVSVAASLATYEVARHRR